MIFTTNAGLGRWTATCFDTNRPERASGTHTVRPPDACSGRRTYVHVGSPICRLRPVGPCSRLRGLDSTPSSSATSARLIARAGARAGRPPDHPTSARLVGLRHVNDGRTPGIRRIGRPARFQYRAPSGGVIRDAVTLGRIRTLAIPPAWTNVWISPSPDTHIQATGRDARGRKQYRYHPDWHRVRDEVKYGRLIAFSRALPAIRGRTAAHLKLPGLPRPKVLAAVVQLLEKTLIRVGNEEYAQQNGSIGLTTMKDRHATVVGGSVRFEFHGKSGVRHAVDLSDPRLARIVKACRDLPGYELFQYLDDDGGRQAIDSADVNAYLRDISGQEYSAKDFRTWAGTVLAAQALAGLESARTLTHRKRNVIAAVESVAKKLGNTRSVCRRCYIHPAILDAYMDGDTIATLRRTAGAAAARRGLTDEEAAVIKVIERLAERARSTTNHSSFPVRRARSGGRRMHG